MVLGVRSQVKGLEAIVAVVLKLPTTVLKWLPEMGCWGGSIRVYMDMVKIPVFYFQMFHS